VSEITGHARVVIIGGGVVGVSALYHLAKAGWTDCVLLEKNELTAGSTWHAAGNVPTFSSSWSIMNMQRYSTELYRGLAAAVDYAMNYHVTGSIRLGHSEGAAAGIPAGGRHGPLPGDGPRNPRARRDQGAIPLPRPMILPARSTIPMMATSTRRS
jgi:glycine/D-amino acid oxidase-like deaminating enzyme